MTVINAFLSTWSNARRTFGNDIPVSGVQFDSSGSLLQLQSRLESAASGSQWSGSAALNYDDSNAEHRRVIGEFARLDRRLALEIDRSAGVVVEGRRNLDSARQWVVDAVASVPEGQAAERNRMAIAQTGLAQLQEILQRSSAESDSIAESIRSLVDQYQSLGNHRLDRTTSSGELPAFQSVDFKLDTPNEPAPLVPGQPVDPANPFIGDQRFGHWESVIALPYTGATPPPLTFHYRPFPEETPLKTGGTTGWYTPGRNWAADAPYAQYQEAYRFRIAGTEAMTYTRMVHENGHWQQERWVRNVYEYQKNTQMTFGGDVSVRGKQGDIAALPLPPHIDYEWKPIGLNEIATLSAKNTTTTYYLPDGCGGQFTYQGGVPVGGLSGLAPSAPIMTRPR